MKRISGVACGNVKTRISNVSITALKKKSYSYTHYEILAIITATNLCGVLLEGE